MQHQSLTEEQRRALLRIIDRLRQHVLAGEVSGVVLLLNHVTHRSYELLGYWSEQSVLELVQTLLSEMRGSQPPTTRVH
jgi:hypothetical protein